jgi:hypothetical protein
MSSRLFEKFGRLKSRIGTTIPHGALCKHDRRRSDAQRDIGDTMPARSAFLR